jgi:hypothetical protein
MMMMMMIKLCCSRQKLFGSNDFLPTLCVCYLLHVYIFSSCDTADYTPLRRKHHYNISGILNGLQIGYDKRVRPNYGGEFFYIFLYSKLNFVHILL